MGKKGRMKKGRKRKKKDEGKGEEEIWGEQRKKIRGRKEGEMVGNGDGREQASVIESLRLRTEEEREGIEER